MMSEMFNEFFDRCTTNNERRSFFIIRIINQNITRRIRNRKSTINSILSFPYTTPSIIYLYWDGSGVNRTCCASSVTRILYNSRWRILKRWLTNSSIVYQLTFYSVYTIINITIVFFPVRIVWQGCNFSLLFGFQRHVHDLDTFILIDCHPHPQIDLPGIIIWSLIWNFLNQIFSLNFHFSLDIALHRQRTEEKRIARRSTLVIIIDEEFCMTICFKNPSINEFDSFKSQFSINVFQFWVLWSVNFGMVNEWTLRFLQGRYTWRRDRCGLTCLDSLVWDENYSVLRHSIHPLIEPIQLREITLISEIGRRSLVRSISNRSYFQIEKILLKMMNRCV